MKKIFDTLTVILGVTVIAGFLFPLMHCGGVADAQAAADPPANAPIVGFWFIQLTAKGNTAESTGLPADFVPPDGAVIDSGYSQWHSDGTEIDNSSREPVTGNFCLGVWENNGGLQYKLNHFAISWTFDGSTETYQGPANIRQDVTVSSDHNSFSGSFTIDQYNAGGNPLVHLTGDIVGQRITAGTSMADVLPTPPQPAP